MEELSIEEKAKRYEEALDNAKVVYKTIRKDLKPVIEQIFPELKEYNGEKIRKGIIKSIMDLNSDWLELHGCTKEDAIAWLVKQTDKKDIHLMELKAKAYDDAKERMSYAYNQNRVPIGFINEIFPDIKLYEKQSAPKDYNSIDPRFGKPINKVEPKFHEGQWITIKE